MVKYAGIKIPAASIQGIAAGTYWVNRNGQLLALGANIVTNEFYDFDTCHTIRCYVSSAGQTGAVGLSLNVTEVWPGGPGAFVPPAVAATAQGAFSNLGTLAIPVAAFNGALSISHFSQGTPGGYTVVNIHPGVCGIEITATTFPTTASDLYVDIWGIKDATFPRH